VCPPNSPDRQVAQYLGPEAREPLPRRSIAGVDLDEVEPPMASLDFYPRDECNSRQ
jgi:hypothetical protein